ncbi:MAG: N-acetyltransferase [Hyphomicrobiales bacterium]|uniref:GNAT family N-acetyltransferase n=1 Tax=Rhabdaerophilum calidifontis TaxID=2604328 RepID=UPI00123AAF77|nr:N-acetyltransferase [Rhabdaerophilum calidifontis]MCA1951624.1 N-acetyltransferase [Hyphomicrobiales bacterium]
MIHIDQEMLFDVGQREALLDRVFGPNRFGKTSERLREGRLPAEGLALVARVGERLVGTLRLWHVNAGGVPALMLGPLAIDPLFRGEGLGTRMMREALQRAAAHGHRAVILVGDAPYYGRFGFSASLTAKLELPGPVDPARFLALELVPGALAGARGLVRATGAVPLFPRVRDGHRRAA